MKSAMKLIAKANKRLEEIKIKKTREEAHRSVKVKSNTLKWCKQVSKELERQAKIGIYPEYSCFIDERTGILLEVTQGDLNHRWGDTVLDLDLVKDWFKLYHFAVIEVNDTHYFYTWGNRYGNKITIKPEPQCF